MQNPLAQKWTTPYELPPFGALKPEHFGPAIREGMKQQLAEIERITSAAEPPSFVNTIDAMERSGELLTKSASVFFNLTASDTNDALQAIELELAPELAKHRSAILMNGKLFARVDALMQKRSSLSLSPEQARVLERYHKMFVRSGARLDEQRKKRLAEIEERLATLSTQFQQNLLADTKEFELVLEEKDLDGLTESFRAGAAEAAKERGKPGKWVVTLQRSSVEPFLQMSKRRDLREKAFKAWAARGDNENKYDNKPLIREILPLRAEKARLLGFDTFAHFQLDDAMAKTPAAAKGLLERVWKPAVETAAKEVAELDRARQAEGAAAPLQPWDWRYYSEKVRLAKYSLNEEQIKPYFSLDRMIEASFDTATRLFGITFHERKDLPKYHPDVRTWEVRNAKGEVTAIFYGDYFARPSKQSGAWMNSFRDQQRLIGAIVPVVTNNLNYNKPPAGEPCLLSYDDAETLFHEFGHALHGMLSNVTYPMVSGTNVARDFVELPSQIYEHWLEQKPVLEKFARHYKTGEAIPSALLDKIQAARNFNQGFATVEYLASARVDMEWHLLRDPKTVDVREQEQTWLKQFGMPREIIMRHRSPHFAHIFAGDGYAAGYYSYMWSEVLDTDGFEAFKEAGNPFDPKLAERLYRNIYSAGNTKDPMELYKSFRGREPDPAALLRHRGFAPEKK